LITDPSQVAPASAVRAVEVGAIAQRQHRAAACFARPPEPPATPRSLIDDECNPVGASDLRPRSWTGGSLRATQRC
jgi:hypothetical protein